MSDFYRNSDGKPELKDGLLVPQFGACFADVVREAIVEATFREAVLYGKEKAPTAFMFNDVKVTVERHSDPELLERDFSRAMSGCIGKEIGPHPKVTLSDEEKAADLRVYEERVERQKKWRADFEAERQKERAALEEKLKDAPTMEIFNPVLWEMSKENNQDSYGSGVLDFAERWARLMQAYIASGKSLEEVARKAGHEADVDGITSFQFGAATVTLIECWKHGKELKVLSDAKKV